MRFRRPTLLEVEFTVVCLGIVGVLAMFLIDAGRAIAGWLG